MIVNLKAFLDMHHPTWVNGRRKVCDLREQDPDFNKGKRDRFFRAFDRAIQKGDFNDHERSTDKSDS